MSGLPTLVLANAISYAPIRMKRLRGYLDHGFLVLDNNTDERSMRGIDIGRKKLHVRRVRARRQMRRHHLYLD